MIILSIIVVLVIIFVIPIVIYGGFSSLTDIKIPDEASPMTFLFSVFISKIGTSVAFVLIYYFAVNVFRDRWLLYAFIWWIMFIIGEVGQAIGPNYSWKEAVLGGISETVYFPLSAYSVYWLLQ